MEYREVTSSALVFVTGYLVPASTTGRLPPSMAPPCAKVHRRSQELSPTPGFVRPGRSPGILPCRLERNVSVVVVRRSATGSESASSAESLVFLPACGAVSRRAAVAAGRSIAAAVPRHACLVVAAGQKPYHSCVYFQRRSRFAVTADESIGADTPDNQDLPPFGQIPGTVLCIPAPYGYPKPYCFVSPVSVPGSENPVRRYIEITNIVTAGQ